MPSLDQLSTQDAQRQVDKAADKAKGAAGKAEGKVGFSSGRSCSASGLLLAFTSSSGILSTASFVTAGQQLG